MKAVIFAGGWGTRLSEATNLIPKPMVEIGGKPILWHIMKTYSHYGINEFIICCGYKQYVIKEYFSNYFRDNSDMSVDLSNNSVQILDNHSENWRVTMVDTGLNTQTGSRLKRVQKYIGKERFLLTYGDGVSDINITDSIKAHEASGCFISLTAFKPGGKFGALQIDLENDKSLTVIVTGSMLAILYVNPKFLTIYQMMMTQWFLSVNLLNVWQKMVKCTLIDIWAFGNQWIPCVIIQN